MTTLEEALPFGSQFRVYGKNLKIGTYFVKIHHLNRPRSPRSITEYSKENYFHVLTVTFCEKQFIGGNFGTPGCIT